jgi:hypothetical protein
VENLRFEKIISPPTIQKIRELSQRSDLQEIARLAAVICGGMHEKAGRDCFRKENAHNICEFCPKYNRY